MASTSPIRGSRRSRSRLLAAALDLCGLTVALFLTVQSPLKAQAQAEVVIRYNGQAYRVPRDEINGGSVENRTVKVWDADGNELDSVFVEKGMTLSELVQAAGVPDDLKTIALERAGGAA